MAVTLTATPEPDEARIAIKAEGGIIGDAFFIGRRGRDGILSLVRETSEASKIWERDPSGMRTNLFARPRFEVYGTAQTMFTNLFRNAALTINPAQNNVMRTNLAANSGFEELVRFEAQFGGGAGTSELGDDQPFTGSQYIRTTWSKAGLYGGVFANTFDVVPGREYTVSVYVRTKVIKRMRMVMRWNGNSTQQLGADTTVRAFSSTNKGWTRLVWQGVAPAGAASGIPSAYLTENVGQKWNVGDWMDIDAMLIEEGKTLGEYFDGSSGDKEDALQGRLVTDWVGDPNRSASVMYPVQIYGITGEQSSIRFYDNGALILPSGNSNASAALIDHGNSMVAGRTYTIAANLEVFQRTGGVHANAGKIVVTSLNGTQVIQTDSTSQAAVFSNLTHTLTVDVPAEATSVQVRIWNGASAGAGRLVFRELRIIEGTLDPGFFHGNDPAMDEIGYGYSNPIGTTPDTGESVSTYTPPAGGFAGVGAVAITTNRWKKNGSRSMRLYPTSDNNDSYVTVPAGVLSLTAGKTYTFIGTQRLMAALTGSLHPDSRRVRITGTGMTKIVSTQPSNTLNKQTTIRFQFTVPSGASNVRLEFVHGGVYGSGSIYWDEILVVEGAYTGNYFDGEFSNPDAGGWNGAKDGSTSFRYNESLAITVYDYEARQGQTMEYFVLDPQGVPVGEGTKVQVPEWGTWLKDPFRTYLNVRLYLNSDGAYSRKANRVIMQPRGARMPIAQWERRTAPEGTVRFLTETPDDARKLTALVDECGVAFLDAAEEFGIPFQYVSLGDVSGVRAVGDALRAPQRYWDIDMQEVAMPIGEPAAMSATYENLMATFSNYLSLRASVPDYKAVAAGEWS